MTYVEYIQNILDTRGRHDCGNDYYEEHHIVPRCIGGLDDEDNLIDLYAHEHFVAHKLLAEENPDNNKLTYAYWMMAHCKRDYQARYELTQEEYEEAKIAFSKRFSGENNPMKRPEARRKSSKSHLGQMLSQETRNKLSEALQGKNIGENNGMFGEEPWNKGQSWSNEVKQKMSDSWDYNKHFTAESRKNISNGAKESWTDDRKNFYSAMMSGINSPFNISVYCPELNESFINLTQAHDKYGICISSISSYLNGKLKSAGKHPITGEKLHWIKLENNIS